MDGGSLAGAVSEGDGLHGSVQREGVEDSGAAFAVIEQEERMERGSGSEAGVSGRLGDEPAAEIS